MKVKICYISLLAVLALAVTSVAQEQVTKEKPAKKKAAKNTVLVAPGAEVKKLAGDFKFIEGPAADAQGNVYFSDIPNNRILRWSVDGKLSTFLENSGGANGLYFDKDGNLIACQGEARRIVSISPKGQVTVLADKYEGKKFNSPNDLWIDPKGGVYFSDPRYGAGEPMEQKGEYVYYLTPDHQKVILVVSDMVRPNGLIGTPNGKKLCITDNGGGKTYVYKVNDDGTLADKKLFAPEGADGMTIDNKGNVYMAVKGVAIYDSKCQKVQGIQVPEQPSNVTFGGRDDKTLFITARTSLYSIQMDVKGAKTPVQEGKQPARKAKEPKAAKQGKERTQDKQ